VVIDRERRQAVRELRAESERLERLDLVDAESDLDLEDTLALVERLRALADEVVVEWPEGAPMRVASGRGRRLRVASEGADWFKVEGTVELDDGRTLALREILSALRGSEGRYVRLGEGEFIALERTLRRQLEQLQAYVETHGKGLRVHAMAVPALKGALDDAEADTAWREHLGRLAGGREAKVPRTLEAELRDYQVEGFAWLARLADWGAGACLADDMGLGKTVQALALILHRSAPTRARSAGKGTLVVAPTSVCYNWLSEAARFAPTLRARLYAGPDRSLDDVGAKDLVVCSYTILQQDLEALTGHGWRTVVLDEAQAIKNIGTRRAQAAMKLQAGFRMITTGTPVENHLGELWTLFRFLVPGLLGSAESFQKRFAIPIERDRDGEVRALLRRLIAPFILRRTKAQVLEQLPPRTEITIKVDLGPEERALYETLRRAAVERLDSAEERGAIQVLAEIMRLRRACCNPRLLGPQAGRIPSAKLEAFVEIVDELLDNRHRALVFSQFTDHLALVRERLDEMGVTFQYLDGSTPMGERRKRVDAFQAGEGDLFLISLKAGGTGLNLTAADYVIHLDPWWNPAVEDQASDRAHRIGQERPVTIYRLVARDTIEERIVELHHRKRELAESLLEGTDAGSRLSAEALLALLAEARGE
jgi:SNF2 family DNA or RNA helicase